MIIGQKLHRRHGQFCLWYHGINLQLHHNSMIYVEILKRLPLVVSDYLTVFFLVVHLQEDVELFQLGQLWHGNLWCWAVIIIIITSSSVTNVLTPFIKYRFSGLSLQLEWSHLLDILHSTHDLEESFRSLPEIRVSRIGPSKNLIIGLGVHVWMEYNWLLYIRLLPSSGEYIVRYDLGCRGLVHSSTADNYHITLHVWRDGQ